MAVLQAQTRDPKKSPVSYRKADLIPAVCYGHNQDTISIVVPRMEFIKMYRKLGESHIWVLQLDGKDINVIVKDYQLNPLNEQLTHVDFQFVSMTEKIEVTIPLTFIGESPLVDSGQGILSKAFSEVTIESLPGNIPEEIVVDISSLVTFDDSIHIKDLKVGKDVEIKHDADLTVVSVTGLRDEKEEEGPTEIDFDSIASANEKPEAEEEEA